MTDRRHPPTASWWPGAELQMDRKNGILVATVPGSDLTVVVHYVGKAPTQQLVYFVRKGLGRDSREVARGAGAYATIGAMIWSATNKLRALGALPKEGSNA